MMSFPIQTLDYSIEVITNPYTNLKGSLDHDGTFMNNVTPVGGGWLGLCT